MQTTNLSPAEAPAQSDSKVLGGRPESFMRRHESAFVLLLCAVAAIRIFAYSAAFPFFGIVDEQQHLDTICRYAHGDVPRGIIAFGDDSVPLIATYLSPEYLTTLDEAPGGKMPPPTWTLPPETQERIVRRYVNAYKRYANTEATQPPVYYATEGLMYDLAKLLGLRGGLLLYWIRFLNVPIYALLVWLSYAFARRFCTASFMRLGLPLIVAFFRQDVYYSLNNDVPSALLFGASLYCLLRIYTERSNGHVLYALAGILAAAAFLTKFSNFPILAILAVLLALRARRSLAERTLNREWPRIATTLLTCGAPIALWLARTYFVVGDITGSGDKVGILGWTAKPFGDIWQHPIFTPGGAFTFWHETMSNLWRGEAVWHNAVMCSPGMDLFYSVSSLVFLAAAVTVLFGRKTDSRERIVCSASAGIFALFVLFMIGMSIAFDFGQCANPSSDHPYFTAGRLMSGGLIPFLVLYMRGLDVVLEKVHIRVNRLAVLLAIVAAVSLSELLLSGSVFASAYNWYHQI